MAKKVFFLLLFLALLSSFFLVLVIAEENTASPAGAIPSIPTDSGSIDPSTGLPKLAGQFQEFGENLGADDESRTAYLKQEWEKILNNTAFFGPIIRFYKTNCGIIDSGLKLVLGIPLSISWLFILTLVLWICFLVYSYQLTSIFDIVTWRYHILVTLIIIGLISWQRIPYAVADQIIKFISLANVWWGQLILVGAVVLILVLASLLSKNIKELFKWSKAKQKVDLEEMNRQKLQMQVNNLSRIFKP